MMSIIWSWSYMCLRKVRVEGESKLSDYESVMVRVEVYWVEIRNFTISKSEWS